MGDNAFRHVFGLFRVLCLCPTVMLNSNIHLLEGLPTYKSGCIIERKDPNWRVWTVTSRAHRVMQVRAG
jgi:hypothetical protein